MSRRRCPKSEYFEWWDHGDFRGGYIHAHLVSALEPHFSAKALCGVRYTCANGRTRETSTLTICPECESRLKQAEAAIKRQIEARRLDQLASEERAKMVSELTAQLSKVNNTALSRLLKEANKLADRDGSKFWLTDRSW